MSTQTSDELNDFYSKPDPWGYENSVADKKRKAMLFSELQKLPKPRHTLDIGCGHGFITRELPGKQVTGVDYSKKAVEYAKKAKDQRGSITYIAADMFDLSRELINEPQGFDLIIITGVMYPQYVGKAKTVMYDVIDKLLVPGGHLISVHIDGEDWYTARFPYVLTKTLTYEYREFQHVLEVYEKV